MTTFLRRVLWPAISLLVVMTIITGFVYPVVVTAVAQLVFPSQANGSLITTADGRMIGSSLIGQCFQEAEYFWGRPSAAGATDENPCGYDASSSAGSNLGPTDARLLERIAAEIERLQAEHGDGSVPVDLVTTSTSGFDPHISPAAAEYQVARVAAARSLSEDEIRAVVERHTEGPMFGFLGQARVNVLQLNLDLDGLLAGS
jgi:K+-transporting ATPase ATPase C chain